MKGIGRCGCDPFSVPFFSFLPKNDVYHGFGTLYYESGDKYEGEWREEMREGSGTLYYHSGDRYEGACLPETGLLWTIFDRFLAAGQGQWDGPLHRGQRESVHW